MHHDGPRTFLQRRQQRHAVRLLLAAQQNTVGVLDTKLHASTRHSLQHGRARSAGQDLDLEPSLFVIAVNKGREITAVLRFGEPIEGERHFGRLGRGVSRCRFHIGSRWRRHRSRSATRGGQTHDREQQP